ncbi:MAG: hypothetical protein HZC45_02360 [Deltaproteobacteria bacterium]|nr:hypothetical protein [Deltaproteobacteria bacterium]
MNIETTPSLYFKEMIDDAIRNQRIEMNILVEFYLVNLLTEFMDAKKIKKVEDEPLVILMGKALNSSLTLQRTAFREIGDASLYLSGFFSDSLSRKVVDIDYYTNIGAASYNYLANLTKGELNSLYSELAERFKVFVDLLTEVSERCSLTARQDILRVYERWIRLKGKRNKKILNELGIEPLHNLSYSTIH